MTTTAERHKSLEIAQQDRVIESSRQAALVGHSDVPYDTDLVRVALDDTCCVFQSNLPARLVPDQLGFDLLWDLHPTEYHEIKMYGRLVRMPLWQQAFDVDYYYTGRSNKALPLPTELHPLRAWCQEKVDTRLNGAFINWYDGTLGHHIGPHRDSVVNLIPGSPIVTISLGEERIFRMRNWKGPGRRDFLVTNGAVIVIPWATNLAWTHAVTCRKSHRGRRVSITFRAFDQMP